MELRILRHEEHETLFCELCNNNLTKKSYATGVMKKHNKETMMHIENAKDHRVPSSGGLLVDSSCKHVHGYNLWVVTGSCRPSQKQYWGRSLEEDGCARQGIEAGWEYHALSCAD